MTTNAITTLSFEATTFDVVTRDNKPWLRAQQIGVALGFKNPSADIANLFDRNRDEFNASMTALVKLPDLDLQTASAGQMREVRVFSLRGANLLGMKARTEKAKAFREWALDVLEGHTAQLPQSTTDTITPSEQQNLQELVDAKCKGIADQGKARAEIWSRLHHKFRIAKYSQLPRTQLTDAQLYIMGMELKSTKPAPQQAQQAAREVLSGRDMAALTRVVWFIARGMGRQSSWTQGVWYYLRQAMNNPAPAPWYVDQLPDLSTHLNRLLIETEAVRTLVNRIEVETVRRLLRRGEASERVLLDMQRLAEKEMDAVGRQVDDELPSWLQSDIKAICDRSMSVYNGHASSAEQPNYFDALTLKRAA